MQQIETLADVEAGVEQLTARDHRLAEVYRITGLPPLRRQPDGFPALLYMITEQMISLSAAAAIWRRVDATFHPFNPAEMAIATEQAYRDCGLSGPKLNAMRALSIAVADGTLKLNTLHQLDDMTAAANLTQIKGIGDWTAQIYLLACLGRPDAWPAGDIALQTAAQHVFNLSERPKREQMIELASDWQPLRAIAARLLWAYYRHLK